MNNETPESPRHQSLEPEVTGDDRLVARGFWRSVAVLALVAAVVSAVVLLRPTPVAPTGSDAPAAPPAPSAAATAGPVAGVAFRDVAAASGVDFIHESGARGAKLLPECLAGGVAMVDLDLDGRLDLVFSQGQPLEPAAGDPAAGRGGVRVYMNRTPSSGGPLRFERLAGDESLAAGSYANGIAAGDLDGDGRADLFIACVGQDRLLMNRAGTGGAPAFVEAAVPAEGAWGSTVGMLDADADGDLDVVVANYVRWSPDIDRAVGYTLDGVGRAYGPPTGFEGESIALLANDRGVLRDATAASGVTVRNPVTGAPYAKALGLAFADADGDGRTDILVANDKTPKFLLRNLGPAPDGTPRFEDVAVATGFAFDRDGNATGAMGIDAAFPRNDGRIAVAVANFANEPSSLYLSAPRAAAGAAPALHDESLALGVGAPTRRVLSFGLVFGDFDLDGDEDLVQANGHLEPDIARFHPSQTYAQRAQFLVNRGAGASPLYMEADAASTGDLANPAVGRALAAGDLDGDGDVDLVLVELGGRARILENAQATGNRWIAVAVEGPCASAAVVEVTAVIRGERVVQRRIASPTRSYQSQSEAVARFGLGDAEIVEKIEVRGCSGMKTASRTGVSAGQTVRIGP